MIWPLSRLFLSKFERMRREFTANVSHELKTPLQTISGAAELLKSGVAKEEDRQRFLDMILSESRRMSRIVGDIIAISRLDDAHAIADAEDVDFVKLTREAVEGSRGLAEKVGVELSLSTPLESPRMVRGSSHFLGALVSNLVENAIYYNRPGGSVDVLLDYAADHITLKVADTGIGIAKEHRERIFERFYRVDKGRSRDSGGTGLGLSIVRNAVRLHKGEISLTSIPGEGSTFTVNLPYRQR